MKKLIVLTLLLLASLSFAQAGKYDMTIEQGVNLRLDFVWVDADGDSITVTGNTIRMAVRKSIGSTDTLLYADTIGGEFSISSTKTGYFSLNVSAARTAELNFSNAYYDIEVQNTSGVVYRFLMGRVRLSKEVTR